MGLDVDMLNTEKLLGPFNRQCLDLVDKFATTVIALADRALGIFVGQYSSHGSHYIARNKVLGCDQLDSVTLAEFLTTDRGGNFAIGQSIGRRCNHDLDPLLRGGMD